MFFTDGTPWVVILLLLLAGAPLTFVQARATRAGGARWTALTSFAIFAVAFVIIALVTADGASYRFRFFGGIPLESSGLAALLGFAATGLGALASLYSLRALPEESGVERFYPLLMLMAAGTVGVGLASDLFSLYVLFELMAVASFGLVAYHTADRAAVESGLRYLVMSASGSLTALLGIALVYLFAGTFDLASLQARAGGIPLAVALPALALMIVGFSVKAAVVPLHAWISGAYSAAPAGAAAVIAGIVTVTGLITLVKALGATTSAATLAPVGLALAVLAVVTMTAGNLWALKERDLKRMLAYSSVAQVGVILLGFAIAFEFSEPSGLQGSLVQAFNNAIMKGGAFLAAGVLIYAVGSRQSDRLAGAGRHAPAVAFSFAVFSLSLAGLPPLSGFIGKLLIAKSGFDAGGTLALFLVLALVANSVLSLGYYLPWINRIAFAPAEGPETAPVKVPWTMQAPVLALAGLVILFGVFPEWPIALASSAGLAIPGGG